MKRFFFLVAMMLLVCVATIAQGKKVVAIEEFTYNNSIETNWVEALRNNIIAGITNTGRMNVMDVRTLSSLPSAKEERLAALAEIGVYAILSCHFNSLKTGMDKDRKYWTCTSNYTITLTEAGGAIISTTPFENTWLVGDNSTNAINKCLEKTTKDMRRFIDNNFKAEAVIKQLDQVDEKKGVITAYVNVGSNVGIIAGQMFEIREELEVAGEKASRRVGTAKAMEVVSGTLTLVKVTEGGVNVKRTYDAGRKLIVITRDKDPIFGIDKIFK